MGLDYGALSGLSFVNGLAGGYNQGRSANIQTQLASQKMQNDAAWHQGMIGAKYYGADQGLAGKVVPAEIRATVQQGIANGKQPAEILKAIDPDKLSALPYNMQGDVANYLHGAFTSGNANWDMHGQPEGMGGAQPAPMSGTTPPSAAATSGLDPRMMGGVSAAPSAPSAPSTQALTPLTAPSAAPQGGGDTPTAPPSQALPGLTPPPGAAATAPQQPIFHPTGKTQSIITKNAAQTAGITDKDSQAIIAAYANGKEDLPALQANVAQYNQNHPGANMTIPMRPVNGGFSGADLTALQTAAGNHAPTFTAGGKTYQTAQYLGADGQLGQVPNIAISPAAQAMIAQKQAAAKLAGVRGAYISGPQTDFENIKVQDQPGLDQSLVGLRGQEGKFFGARSAYTGTQNTLAPGLAASTEAYHAALGSAATSNANTNSLRVGNIGGANSGLDPAGNKILKQQADNLAKIKAETYDFTGSPKTLDDGAKARIKWYQDQNDLLDQQLAAHRKTLNVTNPTPPGSRINSTDQYGEGAYVPPGGLPVLNVNKMQLRHLPGSGAAPYAPPLPGAAGNQQRMNQLTTTPPRGAASSARARLGAMGIK